LNNGWDPFEDDVSLACDYACLLLRFIIGMSAPRMRSCEAYAYMYQSLTGSQEGSWGGVRLTLRVTGGCHKIILRPFFASLGIMERIGV
jgi:hypothetical protein